MASPPVKYNQQADWGNVDVLEASSGARIQSLLADAVINAKRTDALAPITLLVDGNHQAIQFRRQLVRKVASKSEFNALIGVQSFTGLDLLEEILKLQGSTWTFAEYRAVRNQEIQKQLAASATLSGFSENLRDLQALFDYFDSFDWVEVKTLTKPTRKTTKLSLELVDFVSAVHTSLNSAGVSTIVELLASFAGSQDAKFVERIRQRLGTVVKISEGFPHSLIVFLEKVLPAESLKSLEVVQENAESKPIEAVLTRTPDPWTESRHAADVVAKSISSGTSPNRIAVVYSDSSEYAQPLAQAFEEAKINWHGFAVEEPRASTTARAFRALIQCFVASLSAKQVDRLDLLGLVRTGRISSKITDTSNSEIDRFIRSNSMYGAIEKWLPLLDRMFDELEDLITKEEEELKLGEEEAQRKARQAVENAESAGELAKLVRHLLEAFKQLKAAHTLAQLGSGLANVFIDFFEDEAFPRTASDALVSSKIIDAMRAFPDLEAKSSLELAEQVLATLDALLSRLKLQHGEMSRGVYIGPASQNGGLEFDVVLVLGCAEGLLPPNLKQDPLFPDALKESNKDYRRELPTIHERIDQIERHFLAITRDASKVYLSLSTGGMVGGNLGEITRFQDKFFFTQEVTVSGTRKFRLEGADPASIYVYETRKNLLGAQKESVQRSVSSALSFARPTINEHFGQVDLERAGQLFDFDSRNLSASAVEMFLNCGHAFFVTKVLGFPVQDEPDEILNVRALDIGNILHHAFERLMSEHNDLTPTFGQPYSDEAKLKFAELIRDEAEILKAKGLAGWLPRFENTVSTYVEAIEQIFELEHDLRSNPGRVEGTPRTEDAMAPADAEFAWHAHSGSPHLVEVSTLDGATATMRFVGSIDRLNRAQDNSSLSVVDFKTGIVTKTSVDTRVQDLLYASAIRAKSPFLGVQVKKVSSLYFILKPTELKIIDLRSDLSKGLEGIWLDASAGGLTGAAYNEATVQAENLFAQALNEQLSKLLVSVAEGRFPTQKYDYCPCCKLLGGRVTERLAEQDSAESETEDE